MIVLPAYHGTFRPQTAAGIPLSGTIAGSPTFPMSGQETRTIYFTYPSSAQTITLTATPAGGSGSYSYQWQKSDVNGSTMSNISGATSASYDWTPISGGDIVNVCGTGTANATPNAYTFKCVITDTVLGSSVTTAGLKCNVRDPRDTGIAGNWWVGHRTTVRGATTCSMTSLAAANVGTHLSHGDYLGTCTVFTGT